MKYIFAIVAMTIVYAAGAQDNHYLDLLKKYRNPLSTPRLKFEGLRSNSTHPVSLYGFSADRLLTKLANGTRIYSLPQDNMPCLVPDMRQFNMPNPGNLIRLYKYPEPGNIPNPVSQGITFISMKKDTPAN